MTDNRLLWMIELLFATSDGQKLIFVTASVSTGYTAKMDINLYP